MPPFPSLARRAVLAAGVAASLVSLAQAQADVAIVASAQGVLSGGRFTDVKAKLDASGLFNSVTIVDCITTTPTLAQLQAYDAVITWSNSN